jgi:hypothetical protein
MALSKETARKIINVVKTDTDCQKAVSFDSNDASDWISLLGGTYFMMGGISPGSVRNAYYITKNLLLGREIEQDDYQSSRICIGIVASTVKALSRALMQKRLPEVKAVSGSSRVLHGIHHTATWVRLADETEYVFDWHPTLDLENPMLSKADDWNRNGLSTPYALFGGFK